MKKTDIMLADLKISIEHKYDYMTSFCKKYLTQFDAPNILAISNDEATKKEKELVPAAAIEVCESLCIYREIAEQIPNFNCFVFHGAAIEYDGNAYIFTAPSGTGKTTHISLWKKNLGDKVDIINGDKPIVKIGGDITVYGTPWAGKEGLHRNAYAPLKTICILKQGKTNNIVRLNATEAINHLMRQVYMPQCTVALSKTLELLGAMIEKTPVYILECDISNQAFKVAFENLTV